jgi:hypothetical protein
MCLVFGLEWETQDSLSPIVNPTPRRPTMLRVPMRQVSTPNKRFTVPGKVFVFCDTFPPCTIPKETKKRKEKKRTINLKLYIC